MKKALIFTLLALTMLAIFGCSGTAQDKMIVKYDVELTKVRKASDISQRYLAPVADSTMDLVRYTYEDDLFRSIWNASEAGWDLVLYNKSEKPLMIDWDEVSYMDMDNIGHRILASTTKYSERDKPQTPSVIARRGNITESLVSAEHIYQSSTGIWTKRPLWPVDFSEAQRYKDKTVSLIIPFSVDGLSVQYEFIFTINNVREEKSATNPWQLYFVDRALGVRF